MLKPENVQLNLNYILDTLEIDWMEVNKTCNSNKVNLPRLVMIKLRDKFKIRCMMKNDTILFYVTLKQGLTCLTLASNTQKTV